jgi:hypothetical protein
VLEVLRLLVVVFGAGAGYQIGLSIDPDQPILGALNGTAVGLILGSGLGYVIGGMLGRTAGATAEVARTSLHNVSAEQLVAGALGLVGGVLVGAGVAWPVFFLPQAYLAFPLFGFVVVMLGYVGYQIGASKRDGVLAMFGESAGLTRDRLPRPRCRAWSTARWPSTAACSTSCAPASCTAGCSSPPPCWPSCRAWPTPATTCAAARAGAGWRSSRRSSARRRSTSRCSSSTCRACPRSTPSSCASASTGRPPC